MRPHFFLSLQKYYLPHRLQHAQNLKKMNPSATDISATDRGKNKETSYVVRVIAFSKELCRKLQTNPSVYYPTYVSKYTVKDKVIMQEKPKIPGYT